MRPRSLIAAMPLACLRFGRFWYRFPHGESGADVYDRMTIFEDHMIRDINAGRFSNNTSLVLVTHGLALRVFLMRCAQRQSSLSIALNMSWF